MPASRACETAYFCSIEGCWAICRSQFTYPKKADPKELNKPCIQFLARGGIVAPDKPDARKPCETQTDTRDYDPFDSIAVFRRALELHYRCRDEIDEMSSRMLFRDLVNLTIGFEELGRRSGISSKSLHRMLSRRGNPTSRNMSLIICCLRNVLDVDIAVQVLANRRQ